MCTNCIYITFQEIRNIPQPRSLFSNYRTNDYNNVHDRLARTLCSLLWLHFRNSVRSGSIQTLIFRRGRRCIASKMVTQLRSSFIAQEFVFVDLNCTTLVSHFDFDTKQNCMRCCFVMVDTSLETVENELKLVDEIIYPQARMHTTIFVQREWFKMRHWTH